MGGSTRFWWRVTAAVIASIVGLTLGMHRAEVWQLPDWLAATSVTAGVVLAFVASTEAAIDNYRRGRVEVLRGQVRAVLAPLVIEIEELTGISARRLGVDAYRLRRPVLPFRHAYLERLLRLKLVVAVSSGITWRPGIGVVGQCVERGEDIVENLDVLDEQLENIDEVEWQKLPTDVTYGLSYEEHLKVRGKYGVVLATPMIQETPLGSRVIGCVAVDAPAEDFDALAADNVRGLVAAAAATLAPLVGNRG